tara:strand:+ start:221 stop:865 length:645 start_codon:yes stop_codon:yes gene_type:complete
VNWINKDTEIYCSFAEKAGNTGCQMMNTAFYYHGLNKIYKSFSVRNIEDAVNAVLTLGIKGFAITMPYKVQVLKYVHDLEDSVKKIGAANTVLNTNGRLKAYNTDAYAATKFLDEYDNRKKLYIIGNGGYSRAVQYSAKQCRFDFRVITRDDWDELKDIRKSIVYNCTPVEIEEKIDQSNDYINCLTYSNTGIELANLQASKQFELYTGLEFPL